MLSGAKRKTENEREERYDGVDAYAFEDASEETQERERENASLVGTIGAAR